MARSKKKAPASKPAAESLSKNYRPPRSQTVPGPDGLRPSPGTAPSPPPPRRRLRDVRPWVYAGFDFLIAGVWAYLQVALMPNRHPWASAYMWSLAVLPAVLGAAMLVRNRWGWRIAAGAAALVLVLWIILLVLLLAAAAYLSGVYGSFGKAAAMGTLTIALISFNVIALVPALQLKFVLTRAGRRHFRQEPLWR
jgi:hypothetical protein